MPATTRTVPAPPCSEFVFKKGLRLAAEPARCRPLQETYLVEGDTAWHTVTVTHHPDRPPTLTCDCDATVECCSHIVTMVAHRTLHRA